MGGRGLLGLLKLLGLSLVVDFFGVEDFFATALEGEGCSDEEGMLNALLPLTAAFFAFPIVWRKEWGGGGRKDTDEVRGDNGVKAGIGGAKTRG